MLQSCKSPCRICWLRILISKPDGSILKGSSVRNSLWVEPLQKQNFQVPDSPNLVFKKNSQRQKHPWQYDMDSSYAAFNASLMRWIFVTINIWAAADRFHASKKCRATRNNPIAKSDDTDQFFLIASAGHMCVLPVSPPIFRCLIIANWEVFLTVSDKPTQIQWLFYSHRFIEKK